ncbi:MAG: protein disulfide oxidoreductase [Gammaproteobacteria bacterium]|nr:protein disulfide oxidoreductase [Gammaproteobacteria bacterium]
MLNKLKTKKFWLTLLRDISILIVIFYAITLYQTRNTPAIAPELKGTLISGELINLSDMVKKSPVLVYFWGSWCPICKVSSPIITDLSADYQVISIALSSGENQEVLNYLNENNYNFPVLNDPDGIVSHLWSVSATPMVYIIDRDGKVDSVTMGAASAIGLKFRLWLAS